ncbi:HPP family protein [Streptomyces sp. RFCAC02]|uniref:HPP family protein n=1 Tax=Streptomyces sp. RFCAC02 TaxID=2499143 RepID=UPI0010201AFF|nr:HPP family protein [Streptomyces sp. RFCAC02]
MTVPTPRDPWARRLRALRLTALTERFPRTPVRALYCGLNGFVALLVMALLALITHAPFLFPSLGPTAFLLFHTPQAPAAAPRNSVGGHLIGVAAGWLALAVTGLTGTEPNLEGVTWRRALAAALALGLTCALMPPLGLAHPPAGATTLIVALGLLRTPAELAVMMLAVVLLCVQGLTINRLAGIPYPLWRPARAPGPS